MLSSNYFKSYKNKKYRNKKQANVFIVVCFIAIHSGTGVEFAVKSMDKGTYNEFVFDRYILPEELVLHYKAMKKNNVQVIFYYLKHYFKNIFYIKLHYFFEDLVCS